MPESGIWREDAESVIYDSDDIWEGKEARHHLANGDGSGRAQKTMLFFHN